MSHSRRCPPDDSGQIALGLILLVMVLLLVLAVRVFVPFGQATDQKAGSRAAADAAALAGAQQIQEELPDTLRNAVEEAATTDDLLDVMDSVTAGLGRQAASEYADHNDADLIGYRYSPSDGEVWAQVRYREAAENGQSAQSQASADIGLRLGSCALPDTPTPTPSRSGDDADDRSEESQLVLTCGELELDVVLDGEDGSADLTTDLDDLFDGLDPALVK